MTPLVVTIDLVIPEDHPWSKRFPRELRVHEVGELEPHLTVSLMSDPFGGNAGS
ncbi:MAG TPA: hypothetical protein VF288_10590 [Mycobacteriales bacterium]